MEYFLWGPATKNKKFKIQEGKESTRLNWQLKISVISQENIWIYRVLYFYVVSSKKENISSTFFA